MMEQIIRAKKGDAEAFRYLIKERKDVLYRTAFAYVKNEDDAIEIVQEAVYKAFVSISNLKEPAYLNTWLTRILINCAIDHIQKKKRVTLFSNMIVNEASSSDTASSVEEKMDLVDAMGRLEEKYKTVIILKYFQDLTTFQIAEILKCPVGTVKTRIHSALKILKLDLKEECINE
jgi:RNA polymerase sigma-70 factor, ECF subfamily